MLCYRLLEAHMKKCRSNSNLTTMTLSRPWRYGRIYLRETKCLLWWKMTAWETDVLTTSVDIFRAWQDLTSHLHLTLKMTSIAPPHSFMQQFHSSFETDWISVRRWLPRTKAQMPALRADEIETSTSLHPQATPGILIFSVVREWGI